MARKPKEYSRPNRGQWKKYAAKSRARKGPRREAPQVKPGADPRLARVFKKIGVPDQAPFQADPFQEQALEAVRDSDCLVAAPTGSGKTWIAEQAMARILESGGRCWYASPLKALSNAKLLEFRQKFGADRVGIVTGDRKENPDAAVVVGTTEILRNQLYDCMHQGEDLNADFVVLDEAHYLGDEQRGVVWEETLIYLPRRVGVLLLSATVGNARQIADWLESIRNRPCRVVSETRRPVPLFPLFLQPSGRLTPLLAANTKSGGLDRKVRSSGRNPRKAAFPRQRGMPHVGEILKVLRQFDLLPAIFFMKSRKDCDKALQLCPPVASANPDRAGETAQTVDAFAQSFPLLKKNRQRRYLVSHLAGSHHSGQLPAWKMLVENLMSRGLLDAVFATSTVAAGVNFPARTVVMFHTDRFNGVEFLPLSPTELHQMTGRAGRRGMDSIGFSLAVPGPYMDAAHLGRLFHRSSGPVDSQIHVNFSMVLNLLLSHTPQDVRILLEKSLAAFQKKNQGREKASRELWEDFCRHLEFLVDLGYVEPEGGLTEQGLWASALRVDQPLMIAESIQKNLLPKDDPALLAALIAVFVQEKENDVYLSPAHAPKKLVRAFDKMVRELRPLAREKMDRGFAVRPVAPWPAAVLWAWARGASWEDTRQVAAMADGDLAMLILRTADNLRQVAGLAGVFPQTAKTARRAITAIMRDPVLPDMPDMETEEPEER